MGFFWSGRRAIQDLQYQISKLYAEIAGVHTSLASLRGTVNAKLGSPKYNSRQKSVQLSEFDREFIQGLTPEDQQKVYNQLGIVQDDGEPDN